MRRSNGVKVVSLLLGILVCLTLMQAAYAKSDKLDKDDSFENVTVPESELICEDHTENTIDPTYYSMYLTAGDTETFTVSFSNEANATVNVTPKLTDDPYSEPEFNAEWITISPESVEVNPGTEQDFEIEVSVPQDAKSGYYQTYIDFIDNTSSCPNECGESQYINQLYLSVGVQARPKLEFKSSYISDALEAGKEYEYLIKMKNVADKEITIDPEIADGSNVIYGPYYGSSVSSAFSDDIIEISAPSTIKAGEIANMTIRIPVPENTTGTYNGNIEMNVDGEKNDGTVPQVSLYFTVGSQPKVPFVKTFSTTTTDPITIEVSTDSYDSYMDSRISPEKEAPSFELGLKYNSSPVNMTPVKKSQKSSIANGWGYFPIWAIEDSDMYQNSGSHYTETYTIPGAIGDWELAILPKNTENFEYSITFGDSE